MTDFVERRSDTHLQLMVEVGIQLCRLRGRPYAQRFLEDVHVPAATIERVLPSLASPSAKPRIRHVDYPR